MGFLEVFDIYNLICCGSEQVAVRKQSYMLRKETLSKALNGFSKVAFDTRRIDQEAEYNPRRNLQNYNRSEAFITEAVSEKIKSFTKLQYVLNELKDAYGKEHEWQDSNARILLSTLDNGLRALAKDGDYVLNQPGIGSFDYIEQLLHVRYRLGFEDLNKLEYTDLKKVILSKDEELIKRDINYDDFKKVLSKDQSLVKKNSPEITKNDVGSKSYDSLIDKMFEGCKASAENNDVERTITITIRDKFNKEG